MAAPGPFGAIPSSTVAATAHMSRAARSDRWCGRATRSTGGMLAIVPRRQK